MLYETGWKCVATEGVTLSGIPKGMGLSADSTLENAIRLAAEGAMQQCKSLRQKDKALQFSFSLLFRRSGILLH